MKFKKLDELEIIKRGNIFKHSYFVTIGLLLLYYLSLTLDIIFISQQNALLLIIFFIVSLFCIEMILHDIYPLTEKRQRFIYVFLGLDGIVILATSVYDLIFGEASFIENRMISNSGTGIILGFIVFSVLLAYIFRSVYNKRKSESNINE